MSVSAKDIKNSTDEELIGLITKGDKKAFDELVGRHMNSLYSVAYRMNFDADMAEDVLQETFLRIWQKANTWDKNMGAAVSTWMYKIAYNVSIDLKRRNNLVVADTVPEQESGDPSQEDVIQSNEISSMVEDAMKQLPEAQREAIVLCHYQGLTNAEAAKVLDKTVGAVESLLVRGKKTLADILVNKKSALRGESDEIK